MPNQGDLLIDGRWLFEVGGKNKGFKQIKGIEDSFVVSDGIDIGYGRFRYGFLECFIKDSRGYARTDNSIGHSGTVPLCALQKCYNTFLPPTMLTNKFGRLNILKSS